MTRHRSPAYPLRRVASCVALIGLSSCGGGGDGQLVERVPNCTITGVVVTPSTTTISIGESTPLQSQPSSQNCTSIPAATWTSASPSIATVGVTSGQVTAVSAGTAVITASIGSASGSAVVTVRVPPVATIFIAPPSPLLVGQSVTLTADTRDARGVSLAGRAVTWQSSATGIATVSTAGVVTAVAAGTATVTATSEGISQGVTITVTARPPAAIVLTVPNANLVASQTTQATAVIRDAQDVVMPNETVTWLSTNTGVATVSTSGLITAVAPGQSTIRVTSNSVASVSAQAVITVSVGAASSVVVSLTSPLNVTQVATATASVRDAAQNILPNSNVTWTSSSPGVASVASTTGVVTAVSAGTTTITATVVGLPAVSGNKVLTVVAPVATVTLLQSNVLLEPGPNPGVTSTQLTVTLRDAAQNVLTGRAITYLSSNTAVATVSSSGLVTAVAVGTGTITVSSEGVSTSVPMIVARAFAVVDANQPTNTATYQPPQINSAGSPVTVTRTGTGQYRVSLAGIGLAATTIGRNFAVLVNASNTSNNAQLGAPTAACSMAGLDVTGPTLVYILCHDPVSLSIKDAPFKLILIGDNSVGAVGGAAFSLHHDWQATAPYAPLSAFSWNTAGAGMLITPAFGTSEWGGAQVRHSMGIPFEPQHALVSPYSATPGESCELQSQTPASLFSDVVCWNRSGPAKVSHTVVKLNSGRPGQNGGVAMMDGSNGNIVGGFSSATGTVTGSRTGVGKYTVVFGGMAATGAIGVMVTPWGTTGWTACSHYVASTNPVTIDVACFNAFGTLANIGAYFTVLVLQ